MTIRHLSYNKKGFWLSTTEKRKTKTNSDIMKNKLVYLGFSMLELTILEYWLMSLLQSH